MRRVQIQLPEEQFNRLEARAAAAGESVSAAVRHALDAQDAADEKLRRIDVARAAIRNARYSSGLPDVSENHNEYFVQAIEERIGRR
jgi:plasmid stability protein